MKSIKYTLLSCLIIIISIVTFFLLFNFKTDDTIVAVLDTGVDQNNPFFKDRLLRGYDFVHKDRYPEDTNGHGTAMASLIVSMNQNNHHIKILPEKIIGRQGCTAWGIFYAIIHGAVIINMSYHEPYNVWTKWMIKLGTLKGVIFVAASGNQGEYKLNYPAKYPDVISVLATNDLNTSTLGNYGEGLNYVAPGINLKTIALNGQYTKESGTSLSAAYTSATLAYLQNKYPREEKKGLFNLLNNYSRSVLYQFNKKTFLYKTIDFDKIKSAETNKEYFWTAEPSPYTNKKFISLPIDSIQVNKIYVYDNHQLYREFPGSSKQAILPTSEGKHVILILFGGSKHWLKKELTYTIDTLPPVITPTVTSDGNKKRISIHIQEKNLDLVTVNGKPAKPLIDFDKPVRDFTAVVRKEDPIKIIATDYAQNRTIYILE